MASLYELLANNLGNEDSYFQKNPYYNSGLALAKTEMPAARTNTESLLLPILQGLGSGALIGLGKSKARDAMYTDYKSLLQTPETAAVGPYSPETGLDYGSLLSKSAVDPYGTAARPADWTPRIAQQSLLAEVLKKQNDQEVAMKNIDFENKIALETDPRILAAKASIAGAQKKAEYQALQDLSAGSKIAAQDVGPLASGADYEAALKQNAQANLPLDPVDKSKAIRDLENTTYERVTKLPSYKQFTDIEGNFKTLVTLAKQDSSVADVGLITSLNKINDPTSTTREGEYNTLAKNTQNLLDSIQGNWRQIYEGKTKLSPEAKAAIIAAGAAKYNEFGQKFQKDTQPLIQSLSMQGGNPSNVPVPSYEAYQGGANAIGSTQSKAEFLAGLKARGIDKESARQLYQQQFGE